MEEIHNMVVLIFLTCFYSSRVLCFPFCFCSAINFWQILHCSNEIDSISLNGLLRVLFVFPLRALPKPVRGEHFAVWGTSSITHDGASSWQFHTFSLFLSPSPFKRAIRTVFGLEASGVQRAYVQGHEGSARLTTPSNRSSHFHDICLIFLEHR
jgi:hypothetical protein